MRRCGKAYGKKRRICWMEIYSGEKATNSTDNGFRMKPCRRYVTSSSDQRATRHAGRRRHPLAQCRHAAKSRISMLVCARSLLPGRPPEPIAGCEPEPTWSCSAGKPERHLRRHRVARGSAEVQQAHSYNLQRELAVTKHSLSRKLRHRIKPVSKEAAKRLIPQGDPVRHRTTTACP